MLTNVISTDFRSFLSRGMCTDISTMNNHTHYCGAFQEFVSEVGVTLILRNRI